MEELRSQKPNDEQSSKTFAAAILGTLDSFHQTLKLDESQNFYELFVQRCLADDITGESQLEVMLDIEESCKSKPVKIRIAAIRLGLLVASCAFAVQAIKGRENSYESWRNAAEANRMLGLLQGAIYAGNKKFSNSASSARAAYASHQENHALEDDLYAWYKLHRLKFKNAASAARAVLDQRMSILTYIVIYRKILSWDKLHPAGRKHSQN
ncbi:hypothetical protein [Collimonas arenae]|uniref:hypothetical protein n=1 Tax=Collimonas arenae TaxID=279058 RepID=UPI00056DE41B|nr:hypothetical protein [Collimonas arenae]